MLFEQFCISPIFPPGDIWNNNFKCAFFEEKIIQSEIVSLVDVVGCLASRSGKNSFEVMKVPLPTTTEKANQLERDVFHSDASDCVARKGEAANLIRQQWDNSQWFSNSGGSHRSAALWQYDYKNRIKRNIECTVQVVAVSSRIKDIAHEYSMWIFSTINWHCVFEKIRKVIEVEKLQETIAVQWLCEDSYLLLVKKRTPLHRFFFIKMSLALDISDWITCPGKYTYNEEVFCKPK